MNKKRLEVRLKDRGILPKSQEALKKIGGKERRKTKQKTRTKQKRLKTMLTLTKSKNNLKKTPQMNKNKKNKEERNFSVISSLQLSSRIYHFVAVPN